MTLNASRTVIAEEQNDSAPTASVRDASAPSLSETTNKAAAPVVVVTFDWKKWLPWVLGVLVLLLIVWAFTRKRGAGGGGAAA